MSDDHGIVEMREEYHRSWLNRRVWAISENDDGTFTVHQHWPAGVAPPSEYPTLRKAASRLLQLLGTGIVPPQTWPESVCIGTVGLATDDNL